MSSLHVGPLPLSKISGACFIRRHMLSYLHPPICPQKLLTACSTLIKQVSHKVVSFAELAGIRERLPAMANQLDMCQKALAEFLEEKRSAFPR